MDEEEFLEERVNDMVEGFLNKKLIEIPSWDKKSLQVTKYVMGEFRDFLYTEK